MSTIIKKPLKMGIIGIGVGATQIMPNMESMDEIDLMAGADTNPRVRAAFRDRYPEAKVFDSAEALCADPDVEAVWVATPNNWHSPHSVMVANSGKHIVSEKPMALSMKEAEAMVEAADSNGVKLLCGHTLGFSPPVMDMRRIILSGELGPLKNLNNWAFTDWMLQARQPEELDESLGGGVLYRQGPHQLDSLRLLGGGMVRTIRGTTGKWWPERPGVGYYSAFLEFESGVTANVTNNGYGYSMTADLTPWSDEQGRGLIEGYTHEDRVKIRADLKAGERDEMQAKDDLRIGSDHERRFWREVPKITPPWRPANLGILVATCERGDVRQSRHGLFVYKDDGVEDRVLSNNHYQAGREDLIEIYNAIRNGAPVYHDGAWGMATLELITGIMESSKTGKDVLLTHQVPISDGYDSWHS
jgi:phthalate 4,5-cis-dihydrodiol dehydrogenase